MKKEPKEPEKKEPKVLFYEYKIQENKQVQEEYAKAKIDLFKGKTEEQKKKLIEDGQSLKHLYNKILKKYGTAVRVPVYETDRKPGGIKVWVLKPGKNLTEYKKKVSALSKKDHIAYAKAKALIDAEYYEKKDIETTKTATLNKPKVIYRWFNGERWECDPFTGEKIKKDTLKKDRK